MPDPPVVLPGAEEFLLAFWELSTDRAIGMALGPIPSFAINDWADRYEMDPQELASFRGAIRAMDRVFLQHANPKSGDGKSTSRSAVSARPLTPELFDSIFPGSDETKH